MSTSQDFNVAFQALHPDLILSSVESLGYRTDGPLLVGSSKIDLHAISIDLAAEEIPVIAPLEHDGRTLHDNGKFRFAVYPCLGGRAPELDDMALLRQLGRFVARIHLVGETKEYEHRPRLDIASYGEASREYLLTANFIPEGLQPAYSSLCDHLFDAVRACYARAGDTRYLRIHGDFHPSNVLVLDEQLHIVDFDDTRMGPAVQDLWMFLSGERGEQTPQLEELLAGYTEFRHFDARELHLIEALRTLALREQAALMQEEPLVWDAAR